MDKKQDSPEQAAAHNVQPPTAPEAAGAAGNAPADAASPAGQADPAKPVGASPGRTPEKPSDPVQDLRDELKAQQDKYLRVLAEFDNYKRRTQRERQQLVESANAELMLDLTEVRENLERALKAGAASTSAGPVLDGMRLIYAKLDEVLGRHGLEPYAGEGEEFNPALHDAMMRVPSAGVPEGHVAQVVECGYRLKGQVLKHARVVVSAGTPPQSAAAHEHPEHGTATKE